MEAEVVGWAPISPHQPPPRQVPFPFLERLIVGALGGFGVGIFAAWMTFGDMLGAFVAILMAPPLAVVGGACGVISQSRGWAAVRPVVWALLLGALLGFDQPTGWVLGGALGGAVNGLRTRSVKGATRAAGGGIYVGLTGWAMFLWFFLAVTLALGWLIGD